MNVAIHSDWAGKPLAYRLRNGVEYRLQKDSPLLILDFPLKSVLLDSFWKPVFDLLCQSGDYTLFDEIISLLGSVDPDKTEIFLNRLVCKGFLEYEGLSRLSTVPHVSIIIPVRNRPHEIADCLQSLTKIDYPPERLEVIVVDDASTDNTPVVVSRFPVRLIVLKEHRQASFCRNLAAKSAKGDILAFIDSDCIADPLWLRELIPAFKDSMLCALGGAVDSYFNEQKLDRYEEVKSSLKIGIWFRSSREKGSFYVPSCNLLARRDVFLKLGGFREYLHVGEDVDFCWRLQDSGYVLEYRPIGRIYHKHRNKLLAFSVRRFDYGTSEPLLQKLHPKRVKQWIFPPAETGFWSTVILSIFYRSILLFALCALIIIVDSLRKWFKTRQIGKSYNFFYILPVILRSYFTFFYHFSSYVSRYYLIFVLLLLPVIPGAAAIVLAMHLLAGCVEFFSKKPTLNLISFLFYFTVEQFAYQIGVWWGCIKGFYFNPVNPLIITRLMQRK